MIEKKISDDELLKMYVNATLAQQEAEEELAQYRRWHCGCCCSRCNILRKWNHLPPSLHRKAKRIFKRVKIS